MTINKLLKISEVFNQLNAGVITNYLKYSLGISVQFFPQPFIDFFLHRSCQDFIQKADSIVDLKTLIVNGLCENPKVLGQFFQKIAAKELAFLVNSGIGFGFLFGLVQMLQWMVYPKNWTLCVG